MADLFLSYSRKDSDFVRTLHDNLLEKGLSVWVDWQDIPPTVDWWRTITQGIEESNSLVFVLTPNSLESPICHLEIDHAIAHNKRLIPIVRIDVDAKQAFAELIVRKLDHDTQQTLGERDLMSVARNNWQEIARHNWLFFLDDTTFSDRLDLLVATLSTDYEYVVQHTQLLVRARAWEKREHENGLLLRATELKEAKRWLKEAQKNELEPAPTALQIDFITRSSAHAAHQRQLRAMVAGILTVLGISVGAFIIWQLLREPAHPVRMSGKFNIAVAPVYEINNGHTAINDDTDVLTQKIYTEILRGSSTVEGFGKDDIQVALANSDAVESAQDAENIVNDYNAHIVVYGVLDAHNQTFTPRYYLDSDLIGVSEITGESAFGSAIENFPLNINNDLGAETKLLASGFDNRIKILAQFLFGVAAFQSDFYDLTLEYFDIVLNNDKWEDVEGKKILYLWIGTLFERSTLKHIPEVALECPFIIPEDAAVPGLECAKIAYEKAIQAANEENQSQPFARAYLGLGNVYHSWATALPLPICEYYTQLAIPTFREALMIAEQEAPASLTSLKAHFNIGASYFAYNTCIGTDDAEVLADAIDSFTAAVEVADALEQTNEVKALAAQAYYRLGVLYIGFQDAPAALNAFDNAIALTNPPGDDLLREPDWKDVRWAAIVRKAYEYEQLANSEDDQEYWDLVITETAPVMNAYFDANAFDDVQSVMNMLYYRGLAFEALGQLSRACETYSMALQLEPAPPLDSLTAVQQRWSQLDECQ